MTDNCFSKRTQKTALSTPRTPIPRKKRTQTNPPVLIPWSLDNPAKGGESGLPLRYSFDPLRTQRTSRSLPFVPCTTSLRAPRDTLGAPFRFASPQGTRAGWGTDPAVSQRRISKQTHFASGIPWTSKIPKHAPACYSCCAEL